MKKFANSPENARTRQTARFAAVTLFIMIFAGLNDHADSAGFAGLTGLAGSFSLVQPAHAAPPPGISTVPYTVSYSARLTDSLGAPVTTTQDIRFSLWSGSDFTPADLLGSGAIDPLAPGFTGWEEIHTVTPDANGLFQVRLGTITTLPDFSSIAQVYLQVDVKISGAPLTSFEVLDPDGNTANTTDRFPLDSSAFAINADTLDNHDACATLGTCAPGDIPFLDGSAQLPVATIPGATNADTFILDNNNDAPGSIKLQFGNTLNKFLEYDPAFSWFNFNANVNVTGNFTTTGTINGVTVNSTTVGPYDQSMIFDSEYKGAVIQPDTSNIGGNEGTLKDLFSAPDDMNYYHWTTNQVALQDIFLVLKVPVPTGFVAWQATPVQLTYRTGTAVAADNFVDLTMTDTTGAPVTLSGGSTLTSTTFTTAPITMSGSPTFTPGQTFTITLKLNATSAGSADAARLQLNYNGR